MKRSEVIADAAITVLADHGMRGLTHRAVDEAAGLPAGSTSNLARSRAALLELALEHLTALEEQALAEALGAGGSELPELMAAALLVQIRDRRRTLARYELALEANRRPELRAVYNRVGARFRDPGVVMLTAMGSADPARHARQLVAFGEGLMFDTLVGAGSEPSFEELRDGIEELIAGMLAQG
ncbi:TetR/AcrR family transcriptional regulator [Nonomuraea soli]|uniref:AcrR family transcriptional regulator n=1 Tax=Nonomuraea soli TaxID=1032476 RepID=A0A7W0CMH4_9ACTN|nr:TetR/AcrR family transcriptional regulator [Nonomuraea soli]MBA2893821.1 AcrR family transcriptional regulator [Nonomuraea soli]